MQGRPPGCRSAATNGELKAALRRGDLDGEEVEMELQLAPVGVEIMAPPGMEEMTSQLQNMFQSLGNQRTRTRKLKVKDAMRLLTEEARGLDGGPGGTESRRRWKRWSRTASCSSMKWTRSVAGRRHWARTCRAKGVQRDLLPLVEGCAVTTKYGRGAHRPHPVHRLRGLPGGQAVGPDPGTAGPVSDTGGTGSARDRGIRAHPDRAGRVPLPSSTPRCSARSRCP